MNRIQNSNLYENTEAFGDDLPITEPESFIKAVYSLVDEAAACELRTTSQRRRHYRKLLFGLLSVLPVPYPYK